MKLLTIFTPTYNRAYCLDNCYQSLIKQSNQNFIWLIIDDGSTDDTKSLVEGWISENKIDIQYYYQENQGMHGGHNAAYRLIETELNVCIDSDDFMPDNAVEKIVDYWNQADKSDKIAGFIGLDAYQNGEIIGDKIPNHLKYTTLEELHNKYKIRGDKKLVYKTSVVKSYPSYPIFEEERFVPLGTLYLLIDKTYKLGCLNEVLCVVEYLEDGSSRNIVKQYYRHPRGFRYARINAMKHSNYIKVKFKNAIHYVSHCIQLKDFKLFFKTPKPLLTFLAFPFGVFLYVYVYYINKIKK